MIIRKQSLTRRRGVSSLEAAVVYPVTMLLLIGTVVLGIAVFRYEQLQALAREGARYASVHGPAYAADNPSASVASSTDIQNNVLTPMAHGLNGLTCSVTWNPNPPTTSVTSTVTVQLSYSWIPEAYFNKQAVAMTASSTMPVTY
jgi:Flp pilus assembly protein TadG